MGVVVYEKKEKASWVVGDHKPQKHTRQGQAAITHPFSFIHTPFSPPFFPLFLSIPSPLYIMDYTLLKLKNTHNSFSLSLSQKTHTQKRKTK